MKKGFTLIEVLATLIVVFPFLSIITVPSLTAPLNFNLFIVLLLVAILSFISNLVILLGSYSAK